MSYAYNLLSLKIFVLTLFSLNYFLRFTQWRRRSSASGDNSNVWHHRNSRNGAGGARHGGCA